MKTTTTLTTINSNSNNKDSFISQQKQLQNKQQSQQYSINSNLNQISISNFNNSNLNRLDRLPIQIDSLNNNNINNNLFINNNNNDNISIINNNNNNNNLNDNIINQYNSVQTDKITTKASSSLAITTIPCYNLTDQLDIEAGNFNNGANNQQQQNSKNNKIKRNKSLINFKSFDFHIKSIYSGLRNKNKSISPVNDKALNESTIIGGTKRKKSTGTPTSIDNTIKTISSQTIQQQPQQQQRKTPYVRVEDFDPDETENLLITYPQSPYQSRRSSYEQQKSSSQLLNLNQFDITRSQASSPFLCPSPLPTNIRRSSTSDIMCKKPSSTQTSRRGSSADSRRPSTSDLLRRNRERKGSEGHNMMGTRSISHSGLPRGGYRGGRRTSIAF